LYAKNENRRPSALSLKRVHQKRETKKAQIDTSENLDDLPQTPFTNQQIQDLWKLHIQNLNKKGEKLLASLMGSCYPTKQENNLLITLPNARMKADLEKARHKILSFIREELQNYHINFMIHVNEEIEKSFAYTPKEKYEFLREKNALISKLKKSFDLDV
jgi:DNA polymerase-3 subunit gamma/tau